MTALERIAGTDPSRAGTTSSPVLAALLRIHDDQGIGIMIADAEFKPIYASPALLHLVLLDLPRFLELPSCELLFTPDRRNDLRERQAARGRGEEGTVVYESKLLRADGGDVDVELSVTPMNAPGGRFVLKLIRDITRRKQTQRVARVGTWDWNVEADMIDASDETWSILGRTPPRRSVPSDEFWAAVHPEERGRTKGSLQGAKTKPGPFTLDFRLVRPDGTTRFVHVEALAATNGARLNISGNIQDVTDVRFAEQSLQALTQDLMRSNDELEQFAYVASHDLREPLRIISGYLGILDRKYTVHLPDDAKKFIQAAVEGAARMEQLISHLLEYSRVGTHGGDLLPTDSAEALDEAVRNLRLSIEETKAEIVKGELPIVVADRAQLVQLFQNFLANSLKFRRGPPRIEVGATRKGREWEFTVKDNGIGIDEKDYDRVFEIFQRLHSNQEYPGSGIGLAIAKKIVERHGGRIWVESVPGEGSTFHFTIKIPE